MSIADVASAGCEVGGLPGGSDRDTAGRATHTALFARAPKNPRGVPSIPQVVVLREAQGRGARSPDPTYADQQPWWTADRFCSARRQSRPV